MTLRRSVYSVKMYSEERAGHFFKLLVEQHTAARGVGATQRYCVSPV